MSPHASPEAHAHMLHLVSMLVDAEKPATVRAKILMDVVLGHGGDPAELAAVFTLLLDQIGKQGTAVEVAKLKAKLKQMREELESGSLRPATVVGAADGSMPGPKRRIFVTIRDGAEAYPVVPEDVSIDALKPGMTVFLDAKGAVVLGFSETLPVTGQEGKFVRRLPGTNAVQVEFRDERHTVYASQEILDAEAAGELRRGASVLFCPARRFAYRVLPAETDLRHRFVDREKVPDVVPTRDIGKPHWVLGWLLRRLWVFLNCPELCARFAMRPRVSVALVGPSGTGKTHNIRGFLHEFNRMLVEFTGRNDLGTRVVRAKTSDLLSQWFGQTDHLIEGFFNDVQWLAAQEHETADGRRVKLPVVVILEECEGLAKRRGSEDGGVYDRIIGMLLQRLDDTTDDLSGLPVIFLSTTNRPEMVDSAMWARLGAVAARFSRLDREATAAILGKKLKPSFPYASDNGTPAHQLRESVIDRAVAWMFSPNGDDPALVELTLRDGNKLFKHRRDFLTGRLLEQAVSAAIDRVVFTADEPGHIDHGLSAAVLIDALREAIDSLADNVAPQNAADYLDLPEHAKVASVRRIRSHNGRPAHLAF